MSKVLLVRRNLNAAGKRFAITYLIVVDAPYTIEPFRPYITLFGCRMVDLTHVRIPLWAIS